MADRPGLKRKDIEKCKLCERGVAAGGIVFYRVKLEQFGLDHNAIMQQHGLELQLGGHAALAQVMGPDNDLARSLSDEKTVCICGECMGLKCSLLLIALES